MTFLALLVIQGTYADQWELAAREMGTLPLTEKAAGEVAGAYFLLRISGCGNTGASQGLRGERYAFLSGVGYGGSSGPTVWVNRRTGAAWAKGYAPMTDRRVYLRAVKDFRRGRR